MAFLATIIGAFLFPQTILAQVPVIKGYSTTPSGMLYYDYTTATDRKDRTYIYSIRPDSAACISLDYNLVERYYLDSLIHPDPIIVHAGSSVEGPILGTLGLESKMLQYSQSCITVEFRLEWKHGNGIWTALWQSKTKSDCISTQSEGPCADLHDICGPRYHENFHFYGVDAPQALETVPGTCVNRPHNSSWYRFMAQKDGMLSFDILPDNGFDDFDWVLLRGNPKNPAECPDLAQAERKLACNYAAGRGARGATGMGELGDVHSAGATDSPYSQSVQAHKGDVFFLLIDDFSKHSSGFDIVFNDVVMACENVKKDVLHIDHQDRLGAPPVDPRSSFSQYTRVLRIDMTEKANLRLAEAQLPTDLFASTMTTQHKAIDPQPELQRCSGIVQLLIQGLKNSTLNAYSADDFQTPIHYGDLLNLVARERGDSGKVKSSSWWNPDPSAFEPFDQVVELIVDERFDKNTGRARQEIRYIRLIWTDRDGKAPDYNVAVFRYEDVRELADKVPCGSKYNDVSGISLRDILENQEYQGLTVARSNKKIKTLGEAKFEGDRQLELENYLWPK